MSLEKANILFVTDLYYDAKGRAYHTEDIFLTSRLRDDFNLIICHPQDTEPFEDNIDAIVVRNSGPVIHYQAAYEAFRTRILSRGTVVYNSLDGKADMRGKQYLVDLSRSHENFPVIPTIDTKADMDWLPDVTDYIIKPKGGADSIGMRLIQSSDLDKLKFQDVLVQPKIDIQYEVSFYYIDHEFQYALYAPERSKRWQLEPYQYSAEDLEFAQRFINWNSIHHGIQRVDACRSRDGRLLLVELEDLNPYLSLLDIAPDVCQQFVESFKDSLKKAISKRS